MTERARQAPSSARLLSSHGPGSAISTSFSPSRTSRACDWCGRERPQTAQRLTGSCCLAPRRASDLAWLVAQGLDQAVLRHAHAGKQVLGICGGLQVLGQALLDTHGVDGSARGLGLLPLVTAFDAKKTVRRTSANFGHLVGPWSALSGVATSGYEIHHGQTAPASPMGAHGKVVREVMPGLAWQNETGNVLGCYLHGLFESPAVMQALFGASVPTLDSVFDGLADFIQTHVEHGVLDALIQKDLP